LKKPEKTELEKEASKVLGSEDEAFVDMADLGEVDWGLDAESSEDNG